jgi:hypothetical protein
MRTLSHQIQDGRTLSTWNNGNGFSGDTSWPLDTSTELDISLFAPYAPITQPMAVETSTQEPRSTIALDILDFEQHVPLSNSATEMDTLDSLLLLPINQPIFNPPRAFLPRLGTNHVSPLVRASVINTLRSYTYGLLPGHNLPPFIHMQCLDIPSNQVNAAHNDAGRCLPQPLAICASIVQMFRAKTRENSHFIWSTVRMAQQRLDEEASILNDLDVVAALQAITIYIILRISEGDEDYLNFDVPLIQTMMVSNLP